MSARNTITVNAIDASDLFVMSATSELRVSRESFWVVNLEERPH